MGKKETRISSECVLIIIIVKDVLFLLMSWYTCVLLEHYFLFQPLSVNHSWIQIVLSACPGLAALTVQDDGTVIISLGSHILNVQRYQ